MKKFCSQRNKIFVGILIILAFSKSGIQYMCQEEISEIRDLEGRRMGIAANSSVLT